MTDYISEINEILFEKYKETLHNISELKQKENRMD
jgi:hypothetical protein